MPWDYSKRVSPPVQATGKAVSKGGTYQTKGKGKGKARYQWPTPEAAYGPKVSGPKYFATEWDDAEWVEWDDYEQARQTSEETDRKLRKSLRTLKELALEYPEGGYDIKIEEIQEQLDTIQQEAHSKVPLPKRLQRSNQKITKLEAKTAKLAEQAKSLALTIEQNQQWLKEVEESIKATDEALKEQNKENSEIAHLMAEAGDDEDEDEDEDKDEFMGPPPKRRSNVNTPRDQQAPQQAKLLMSQIDPDGQLYKDLESFCRAGERPKGKTNQKEEAPNTPTGHQEGKGKAKGQVPKPDQPHKNTEDTPNKGEGHSSDSKEDGDRSRSPPAGRAGAKGSSSGSNKKSGSATA